MVQPSAHSGESGQTVRLRFYLAPVSGVNYTFLILLLTIHVGHFLGLAQHLKRLVHESLQLIELSAVR